MMEKVYKTIDKIDVMNIMKRLDEVKYEINNNDNITSLIRKFNYAKESYEKYDLKDDFIKAKIELMKEPLIKSYLEIQNEINMLSLYINQRFNKITRNTACSK